MNSQVLVLVRSSIAAFEREHGEIGGDIGPDVNVKLRGDKPRPRRGLLLINLMYLNQVHSPHYIT